MCFDRKGIEILLVISRLNGFIAALFDVLSTEARKKCLSWLVRNKENNVH